MLSKHTESTLSTDVVVIGGGHAGVEAAHAAATMGAATILVSLSKQKIGSMPCNPAIGGVGKGHMVFEISALGGLMPCLATQTYLQARMLNTRKGPAVQGLRLQIDKHAYAAAAVAALEQTPNLTIIEAAVEDILLTAEGSIKAIVLNTGVTINCCAVVVTTGTFMNGRIHIGALNYAGGRRDEKAISGISNFLKRIGLVMGRLKTGTPPRLLRSSLDFSKMTYQEPDQLTSLFEFYPHTVVNRRACFITHTNEKTHDIIRDNLEKSAMYSGAITGVGPRYCPSIEDKIGRFKDKLSHHVFVEPEDVSDQEIYPNGISTSLPLDVQQKYVQTISGFEHAIISKPGYAVEYDFVLPNQLNHSLMVKKVSGLYLAGQINGTTGYEEAAGQGIIAGINAACQALAKEPFVLSRNEAYIGVMIDDLVTMGIDEPYRMFTSRAERRLLLRQDNVFARLMPKAYKLGMVPEQLYANFVQEHAEIEKTLEHIKTTKNLQQQIIKALDDDDVDGVNVLRNFLPNTTLGDRALRTIHAELLYAPYLAREEKEAERLEQYQTMRVPDVFCYTDMPGLSKELQSKLTKIKPATIAAASLIPGMTPAALSLLIFKIRFATVE